MKPTPSGIQVSRRALIGPARAAEFSYKLATGQSLTQPINARLEQACGRIREATNGRLEIRFFPASQLGSDTDLLAQVRSGATEFLNIAGSVLSTIAPAAAITNVGFAFSNYDQVWSGMDGSLGAYVRAQIEKTGYIVVSKAADNSFRQITSYSKPIKTPEDLKGYRIRVPVSAIFVSLFKALGASPTSINFNELYTALQTRIVDGQENGLVAIEGRQALRGSEIRRGDEPHLGSVLAARQSAHLFQPAGEYPSGRSQRIRSRLGRAARGQRASQHLAQGGTDQEGSCVRERRPSCVSRGPDEGRLLQGVARQVRRRGMD